MPRFFKFFVIFFTIVICFTAGNIEGQTGQLPKDEVEVLKEIAVALGKKDWDFKLNPCDGNSNWNTTKRKDMPLYSNILECNCTLPDNLCHVENITLTGQDLAGVLPASLAKLPYLKKINLNRNYLNGTIPPEWASTKLEVMAISNNRLSGHIPEYIGNMTSLVIVSLETNLFNGSLPAEVGNLVNLQRLILNANNFTGEWPVALNNLTKLIELRISSNSFVGKLPNFESWKNLQMLEIEGSGFEGPIPQSVSALTSLTELRISDLNGGPSEFPSLTNMTTMEKLVLRSCNIHGNIHDSVAELMKLRFL